MTAAAPRVVEARAPLGRAVLHAVVLTLVVVVANAIVTKMASSYPAWAWVLTSVALPIITTVVETVRSSQPVTAEHVQSVPASNGATTRSVVVDPDTGAMARAVPLMAALAVVVLVVGVGALLLMVAARGLVGLVNAGDAAGGTASGTSLTSADDGSAGTERLREKVSGEFDGVTVRVSSVAQTETGTRVHVTVENRTSNSIVLPLGPACTFSDSHDSTIQSDAPSSRWPEEFPAGLTQSGDIWFPEHIGRRRQSASLAFANVFRAVGEGPSSIRLSGLRLTLAEPHG